jgi:hypothetical protein
VSQPERTALAFDRGTLAAVACALLLLDSAVREHWGLATVPAVLAAITAAVLANTPQPTSSARLRLIGALTTATCLAALLALL